jgi:hypothetical protein
MRFATDNLPNNSIFTSRSSFFLSIRSFFSISSFRLAWGSEILGLKHLRTGAILNKRSLNGIKIRVAACPWCRENAAVDESYDDNIRLQRRGGAPCLIVRAAQSEVKFEQSHR